MGSNPFNCFLKIWEFIRTLTPKVGVHLGVWRFIPSHFPTLLKAWNVILGLHSGPAPSQALALVTSPKLGLWHSSPTIPSSWSFARLASTNNHLFGILTPKNTWWSSPHIQFNSDRVASSSLTKTSKETKVSSFIKCRVWMHGINKLYNWENYLCTSKVYSINWNPLLYL
jgi:hypothetical protein